MIKVSASVATAGMAIPFGMGCAVSLGLYKEFSPASVEYPHFLLFIGTSMQVPPVLPSSYSPGSDNAHSPLQVNHGFSSFGKDTIRTQSSD